MQSGHVRLELPWVQNGQVLVQRAPDQIICPWELQVDHYNTKHKIKFHILVYNFARLAATTF